MDYKNIVAKLIKAHVELDVETIGNLIEIPPKLEMGDYTFPCYHLSKVMGKAPNVIAEELKNYILTELVDKIEILGEGSKNIVEYFYKIENIDVYLNFFVNKGVFAENTIKEILENADDYGMSNIGEGKTICIEYSSVNIAKPFNVSQLFNTAIGNALYKMFKKEGYNVIGVNYFEDFGIEFSKFISVYNRLGKDEAFYNDKMNVVVDELKEKGILVESNRAKVVMLKEYNMPPYIVFKESEAQVYANRDLAVVVHRKEIYDFHKCIYVAEIFKALHFKQVFKVLELLGHKWAEDCVYVGGGLVKFADGNSFRKRDSVISVDDLINEMVSRIIEIIKDEDKIKNKEEAAKKIGVGALIFTYLKNSRDKDVVFDWEEILSLEGDNGLYVQYIYIKGSRILAEATCYNGAADYSKLYLKEEFKLVKALSNFNNIIILALDRLEPSILARYIIEVAKGVNKLYEVYLLLNENEALKAARLNLIKASLQVIKNGLELIGIEVVENVR